MNRNAARSASQPPSPQHPSSASPTAQPPRGDAPGGRPQVLNRTAEVRAAVLAAQHAGRTVGLVPTMGALHAGHISLVQLARAECDCVAVTIFVNPTQFGPNEDLNRYPRTLEADLRLLAEHGADLVFTPAAEEMYPAGFSTFIEPPQVARRWEGEFRPGHFRGVATVVLKLFQQLPADRAYFGEKDFQQLLVIRRMAEDLNVTMVIRGCPIIREADGLALSSRNVYLSMGEREQAVAISRGLRLAVERVRKGETDPESVRQTILREIKNAGISRIDYVAIVDPVTLEPSSSLATPQRALVAVHVGRTRLIDNVLLE